MAISRAPARQTRLELPMPSRLQQTSKRCQISTRPSAHRSDTFLLLHISIFPSLECGCPSAVITFPSAHPYIESASRYLHCLAQDGRTACLVEMRSMPPNSGVTTTDNKPWSFGPRQPPLQPSRIRSVPRKAEPSFFAMWCGTFQPPYPRPGQTHPHSVY